MTNRYFIPVPKLPPETINRFWSHVDKTPGQGPHGRCWTWTGARDKKGYARIRVGSNLIYVHRIGFTLQFGKIPKGKRIMHECDNYPCIRCLYAGTQRENMNDCRERGRNRKAQGSKHGCAKLTEQQVIKIRNAKGTTITIAKKFKVDQTTISLIRLRRIWKHI